MVSTALKGRSGSGRVFKRVLNCRWKVLNIIREGKNKKTNWSSLSLL